MFGGDHDTATQREQHDVHGRAVAVSAGTCRDHPVQAPRMLGERVPDRRLGELRFDHRTLRMAHDTLAAATHVRTGSWQRRLPLEGHAETTAARMLRRRRWLALEPLASRDEPPLVQR